MWRQKNLGWQAYLDGRGDTKGRRTADRKERGFMTDADHAQTYEQRVQAIQLANQPILEGFENWLRQSGLSEPTIKDHVDNIRLFSHYLLLYAYSLRRLDEATEGAVYDFLEDWFPRKALWASVTSMKVYLVSNSDIILKSARGKLPSWGAWDILKATWLSGSRCLKEGTHVSTRGTIHDQRDVSQGDLDQRDCPSDWTRSQNYSAGRHCP